MHYSTCYTLYRDGKTLKLEVSYNCQSDIADAHDIASLEILHITPPIYLSEEEKEEVILHCWSDVSIQLGEALLDELENSCDPLKIRPVNEAQ